MRQRRRRWAGRGRLVVGHAAAHAMCDDGGGAIVAVGRAGASNGGACAMCRAGSCDGVRRRCSRPWAGRQGGCAWEFQIVGCFFFNIAGVGVDRGTVLRTGA